MDSFNNFISNCATFLKSQAFITYYYPIVSSLFAGLIFWVIFSYIPEKNRKKHFRVTISEDLYALYGSIFSLFNLLTKARKNAPSPFQKEIRSCKLTRDLINTCLQNKSISEIYTKYPALNDKLIFVREEYLELSENVEKKITSLITLNEFLEPSEIQLLRNIQENIFRYLPHIKSNNIPAGLKPADPSLSYLTEALLELQSNFKKLSEIIFASRINTRDFYIKKIQYSFYQDKYKETLRTCNQWTKSNPFDSTLQKLYSVNCRIKLNDSNTAYEELSNILEAENLKPNDHRGLLHLLMADQTAARIMQTKIGKQPIDEMVKLIEQEDMNRQRFLTENLELKKFYKTRG